MNHLKLRTLIDGEFVPVYLGEEGFYRAAHILVRKKDVDMFIWLKDQDGNEVWQNDIVEYIWMEEKDQEGTFHRARIGYSKDHHAFMLFGIERWPCTINHNLKIGDFLRYRIKLIGNYRKNPELMK